jgi:DNA helicase-2/ATP-dependent DNA helicase PcrA
MPDLDDIDITGIEEYPADTSVKLNGPPGTGKTTESAARVATLLQEHGYDLSDVLWATYRRSLALDTLDRLAEWGVVSEQERAKPRKGATRHIGTMHAVANRLVGGLGDPVGYADKKQFAAKRQLRYDKRSEWDDPGGRLLFRVFDYAANNLLDLHDAGDREQVPAIDDLRSKYAGDVGRAWDSWQEYKQREEKIDFWEMLKAPLRQGLTLDKDIVVIDEYHDAYPLYAQLAESWIDDAEIAIVAGDPLQVVNAYDGATPEFYKRVGLPEVALGRAWERPPAEHWGVATQVLANGHNPPSVEIDNSGSFHVGNSPKFSYDSDAGWRVPDPDVARSPARLVEDHGMDTMFLTRTQKQAAAIARALEKAGVLYETQTSMDIDGWGAREDMSERTALYNALQRLTDIKSPDAKQTGLARYGDDGGDRPIDAARFRHREAAALLDHTNHEYLENSRDAVTKVASGIETDEVVVDGAALDEHVTGEFWDVYGRGAGATRHLNKSANRDEGSRLNDHDLGALQAALEQNDAPVVNVETAVRTIHASKGTEAENVVVYDGITSTIRDSMQQDTGAEQNEWRTWYVALTRSRANLFVLRDGFDWTVPFLPENLISHARKAHQEVEADD